MHRGRRRDWRVLFLVAFVVLLTSFCARAEDTKQAESLKPSVSLTIKSKESVIKAGEPVLIEIITTNDSDHILRADTTSSDDPGGWIFEVDVKDEQGNSPAKTDFYRNIRGYSHPGGMYKFIKLKPGEHTTDALNVAKLYDMAIPGQYTMRVRRFDLDIKGYAKSNEITVTVTL